jgi:hypothetical protein
MKNLLIYTNPQKKFLDEDALLAKIQIDNSLSLGWDRSDMILVTNFNWEYKGMNALNIDSDVYYDFDLNANKIPVIIYLINHGLIESNQIYWCHDFDAYELNSVSDVTSELSEYDLGLVHYFYKPEWALSNFFFKLSAKDILELINTTSLSRPWKSRNNEKTLTWLIKHHKINPTRYKKLNVTFNIAKRCLETIYQEAEKPIKVLHFRPSDKDQLMPDTALNMFMYGKNRLNRPLMSDRLIEIFNQHGLR